MTNLGNGSFYPEDPSVELPVYQKNQTEILDALQEIGVLQGDGRKYIAQVIYSAVEVDKKNPRVEVEIREVG